jgi:hypothetical protein
MRTSMVDGVGVYGLASRLIYLLFCIFDVLLVCVWQWYTRYGGEMRHGEMQKWRMQGNADSLLSSSQFPCCVHLTVEGLL